MFTKLSYDLIDALMLKEAQGLAGLSMGAPRVAQPAMRTGGLGSGFGAPAGGGVGGIKPPPAPGGLNNVSMGAPKVAPMAGIRGAGGIAAPGGAGASTPTTQPAVARKNPFLDKAKGMMSGMFGGGTAAALNRPQVAAKPGGTTGGV